MMNLRGLKYVLLVLGLAAVYLAAALFGFTFSHVAEQVTLVWPPTGIALAAGLIFGYPVWPGIALGALLANVMTDVALLPASGIAVGNTLEAVAGAWLLLGLKGFDSSLRRPRDVVGLIAVAVSCTVVSATIGTVSL